MFGTHICPFFHLYLEIKIYRFAGGFIGPVYEDSPCKYFMLLYYPLQDWGIDFLS